MIFLSNFRSLSRAEFYLQSLGNDKDLMGRGLADTKEPLFSAAGLLEKEGEKTALQDAVSHSASVSLPEPQLIPL